MHVNIKMKMINHRTDSSQKATRKTDKVRPEDVDVIDLSNEALKDLLLKYGLNAGPIVGEPFLRFKHEV